MNIDVHAHIIVPEITADADFHEAWRPRVVWEDSRQVVEAHGGQIEVADSDEHGTTLRLFLPRHEGPRHSLRDAVHEEEET